MRVRTPRDLGAVIRARRKRLRLDQGALARRVGVSRQWIVAIESGKPRADMMLVLRTLEALGLALDVEDGDVAVPAATIEIPDIDAIVDAARRPAPAPPRPAAARRAKPGSPRAAPAAARLRRPVKRA